MYYYLSTFVFLAALIGTSMAQLNNAKIECNYPEDRVLNPATIIGKKTPTDVLSCIKCRCIKSYVECDYVNQTCKSYPPTIENQKFQAYRPKSSEVITSTTTTTTRTPSTPASSKSIYATRITISPYRRSIQSTPAPTNIDEDAYLSDQQDSYYDHDIREDFDSDSTPVHIAHRSPTTVSDTTTPSKQIAKQRSGITANAYSADRRFPPVSVPTFKQSIPLNSDIAELTSLPITEQEQNDNLMEFALRLLKDPPLSLFILIIILLLLIITFFLVIRSIVYGLYKISCNEKAKVNSANMRTRMDYGFEV